MTDEEKEEAFLEGRWRFRCILPGDTRARGVVYYPRREPPQRQLLGVAYGMDASQRDRLMRAYNGDRKAALEIVREVPCLDLRSRDSVRRKVEIAAGEALDRIVDELPVTAVRADGETDADFRARLLKRLDGTAATKPKPNPGNR